VLVEESRESIVVLDGAQRVVAASRRARETVEGLAEGAIFPDALLRPGAGRTPLVIPYNVVDRRETLVYLSDQGDYAAYEELRAGFTAAVSHELRTPLARLMAVLEGMALPGSDSAALAEQARSEVSHIGELIDDVLFISELESGRIAVSLGSLPVLPVLEQVVTQLRERAEDAGVTLRIECPASFRLPIRQRMLEVVAKNMAENAIRYAGTGTAFTFVCHDENGSLLVGRDDGIGVPEEDLPRIFERFYRGDRARTSRGTGLGLAIVKHIVTAAGGAVDAHSSAGGGLEIRCLFPRREAV